MTSCRGAIFESLSVIVLCWTLWVCHNVAESMGRGRMCFWKCIEKSDRVWREARKTGQKPLLFLKAWFSLKVREGTSSETLHFQQY
jgi:hypothetical protein